MAKQQKSIEQQLKQMDPTKADVVQSGLNTNPDSMLRRTLASLSQQAFNAPWDKVWSEQAWEKAAGDAMVGNDKSQFPLPKSAVGAPLPAAPTYSEQPNKKTEGF